MHYKEIKIEFLGTTYLVEVTYTTSRTEYTIMQLTLADRFGTDLELPKWLDLAIQAYLAEWHREEFAYVPA